MKKFPVLSRAAIEAYDHLSLPVWLFSVETLRILSANTAAQEWIGYDAQTLEAMTIADLRPEPDRERIVDQVSQFDGPTIDAGTWTIIARSGDLYTASFHWRKVTFEGTEAIVASIRDVTQIAQAEVRTETLTQENESLRRRASLSAAHLSSLFDSLPGKMLVLTPHQYQIVAVTDEYAQAVMLERDALLGEHLFDLFPDDPAEPQANGAGNLRASLRRVEALRVTDVMNMQRYPVRQPDGSFQERYWLPRSKPVLDADGHIIYIVHRVEDVTGVLAGEGADSEATSVAEAIDPLQLAKARTALHVLQERETRLKTAEMLLDLGSWEYDLDRGELHWSDRVFEIYGVPREHGAPDFDGYVAVVHPEDRDQMVATYTRFFESGAPEIEFQHRVIRTDGGVTHVRGVGARHLVDDREIVIGFLQDITYLKQVEEKLLIQARRRRLAGSLARLGSWRVGTGDTHVMWCEETAALHDEPEGASPTVEDAINYYIPEHRDRIRTRFEACATKGHPFDETLQIETAKGRLVWVRALGEPIRDESGAIVAVEGAFQDITDLIAAQNEATELSARLQRTLEGMSDAFFLLDDEWQFAFINSTAASLLQRTRDDLLGKSIWQEFPDAVGSTFQESYERAVAEGTTVRFREYFPPLEAWFEVTADSTPFGLAVYFHDVTEEVRDTAQRELINAAIARLNDVVLITEAEPAPGQPRNRIIYANEAARRLTGYGPEELVGQTPKILQGPDTPGPALDRLHAALWECRDVQEDLINYTPQGKPYWVEINLSPIIDESGVCTHFIAVERDISERKNSERTLHLAATRDPLTGLPNRRDFKRTLKRELEAVRNQKGTLALLFMDIDNFKDVNDLLGHSTGDELLFAVSQRLAEVVRQIDFLARFGGDEFMVIAPGADTAAAQRLAERLVEAFLEPFHLDRERISLTTSIGIVMAPEDGKEAEELTRKADIAMYRSKAVGRNQATLFDEGLNQSVLRSAGLTQALQQALTVKDGFSLVYQPQYTLEAEPRLVGAEALLRWQHPTRGAVSPGEFIPAAERAGLIRMLDCHVIEMATRQIGAWSRQGRCTQVSVNVSVNTLQWEGFAAFILAQLHAHGVPPRLFSVEIIETLLLESSQATIGNLLELRRAGICIAIDDFGTGHSSLSNLQNLPVDMIKIDQSFVQGLEGGKGRESALLIQAILAMAQSLELQVVAEGVETDAQRAWLTRNRCQAIQGFLIGRPAEPESFARTHLAGLQGRSGSSE